jgi:hypothetical protein
MKNIDFNRAKLVVEINDGSSEAVVKFQNKDGVATKTVSVAALLAELSRDMEITTGVLPSGTKFYAGTKNSYRIGIQVQAKVRTADFTLHEVGTRKMTVPFPEILFVFCVKEKRIIESTLYACVPPIGRTYDRLYRFPFGNVWENGSICWGNAIHPEIGEPIVLDSVVSRFFTSVFSGHLIHGTNMFCPPDGVVNLRTLLEHLSGREHFPDRILKPSDMTVGTAMAPRDRR